MRILAIESSAVTASVAVLTDKVVTAEYTVNYKKTHSQTLLQMIDEIFKMTETKPETVDLIAVSVGPGSFTGLRIGAATGKGLALALDKPMAAVNTLEAMAWNLYGTDKLICPVMDAKRQHLYTGIYEFENCEKFKIIKGQSLLSFEEIVDIINEMKRDVVFVGDGIDTAGEYLREHLECRFSFAPAHLNTQRAASVAMLALDMYNRNEIIDSDRLHPEYLRLSQAERQLAKKASEGEV